MKKLCFLVALMSALIFALFVACSKIAGPSDAAGTDAVLPAQDAHESESDTVSAGVGNIGSFREATVYYPDGASKEDAVYMLSLRLPVFSDGDPVSARMNEAVSVYEDELTARVLTDRLPYADGVEELPSTVVESAVTFGGGYTNLTFTERFTFGDGVYEEETYSFALDRTGEARSLYYVTGTDNALSLAAQQVYNIIEASPEDYFGDITLDDIPNALDLYEGFLVAEDAYILHVDAGMLADASRGELTFTLPMRSFYPETVGGGLEYSEYEAIRDSLDSIVAACAQSGAPEGFSNGIDEYTATAFLTRMFTTGAEDALFIPVESGEYEAAYTGYFASPVPDTLLALGDGTFLSDEGGYMLPVHPRAEWRFRLDDAVREGDTLTLFGVAVYGEPGEEGAEDSSESLPATLILRISADSPTGFAFCSVAFE